MSFIYLLIEFVDELVFGVGEVALPLIRNDIHLTYTQIGLLLSLPGILGAFIEPFIGVLGDVWKRRVLIIAGGMLFTLSLFMTSVSYSFIFLLSSFILFFPSSGAFVSLSQANLMDFGHNPPRTKHGTLDFCGIAGSSRRTSASWIVRLLWLGMARDVLRPRLFLGSLPARGVTDTCLPI